MKPRYTILIKQPGLDWRELCGVLYLQWAKGIAEDHAKCQPWDSTEYHIYSNNTGNKWIGQIKGKQIKWREPS